MKVSETKDPEIGGDKEKQVSVEEKPSKSEIGKQEAAISEGVVGIVT